MNIKIVILIFGGALLVLGGYAVGLYFVCDSLVSKQLVCDGLKPFSQFYAANLRGSLFAGFLTLGGFLMSLKTFIIVNMKKEVYDTAGYKELHARAKKTDPKSRISTVFGPLRNLSTIIYATIVSCISTAVSQLTVGLFGTLWSSIFCVWMAVLSIMFLVWCLHLIRANLTTMFDHLDEQNP